MEHAGQQPATLRRELSVWEAIGISLALMAPSMAANINPQGTAGQVGRAVPLAFAIATIGVLLVAYGFVRLTQRFHHAGSVYGFVGVTLGPRAGVFAGHALLGTYIFYACVTAMAAGIFGADFLQAVGIIGAGDMPRIIPFIVGFIALAGAWFLALVPARNGTRVLLTVEGVTVALILITVAVILIRLLTGGGPEGQTFTLEVFTLPEGATLSAPATGAVFGFLSFAGFEAAATLGEEAHHPTRDIPRAILGVAVFGGLYFVVVTAVEVMGFGTGEAGMTAFTSSGSLLGDLGTTSGALAVVTIAAAVIIVVWALAFNAVAFDVFVGSGVIGTLILLVAYGFATIGAIKHLFFTGAAKVPMYEILVPIAAFVVLLFTLWLNLSFDTASTAFGYELVVIAWLLVGALIVFGMPGLARRAADRLAQDEGLAAANG